MKRLTVIIAPAVERQIDAQAFLIAADSVDNALAWENRLRTALYNIGDAPGLAIDEDVSERLGYIVRKTVFEGTYLILLHRGRFGGHRSNRQLSERGTFAMARDMMTTHFHFCAESPPHLKVECIQPLNRTRVMSCGR